MVLVVSMVTIPDSDLAVRAAANHGIERLGVSERDIAISIRMESEVGDLELVA